MIFFELNEEQRNAVVAQYRQGKTVSQIARSVKISPLQVAAALAERYSDVQRYGARIHVR